MFLLLCLFFIGSGASASDFVSEYTTAGDSPGQVGRESEAGDIKVVNGDGTWSWAKPIFTENRYGYTFDMFATSSRVEALEKRVKQLERKVIELEKYSIKPSDKPIQLPPQLFCIPTNANH